MLIDTHAHIYSEDYEGDRAEMMARAAAAGVEHIVMPSIGKEDYEAMVEVLHSYPHQCSAAIGLHPAYVGADYREELDFMRSKLDAEPWVAVGEIGLDYYHSTEYKAEQHLALREQLGWALERDLPVIFHVREAFADLIAVLREPQYAGIRGIIHSFTGTEEELKEVLTFPNLMVAINGVATFKNAKLREYIGQIPLERVLVETDAPYLSPTPLRGKRNEPAYIVHTAGHIAQLWGLGLEDFARHTTANAKRLYRL